MPTAGGMEGGNEGEKEQGGGAKKGGRGKAFTFPELMCCMWAALGTNEKFSNDAPTPVRLSSCRRPSAAIASRVLRVLHQFRTVILNVAHATFKFSHSHVLSSHFATPVN